MNPRILVLAHHPSLAALLLAGLPPREDLVVVTASGPEPPPVPVMQEREEEMRLIEGAQWPGRAVQEMVLTIPRIEPPPLPFDPRRSHGKRAQRRRARKW